MVFKIRSRERFTKFWTDIHPCTGQGQSTQLNTARKTSKMFTYKPLSDNTMNSVFLIYHSKSEYILYAMKMFHKLYTFHLNLS